MFGDVLRKLKLSIAEAKHNPDSFKPALCFAITLTAVTLLLSAAVPANGASATPEISEAEISAGNADQLELMKLMAVLNEETEIATKTKMNNDYVPGMVTVLHGEQMEAIGARTVLEALSLVPGIQISRISSGEPTVKVRGISYPFNAGNIKVMLNSIALSRESSGINSSVLLTPVAQVDRIEVIRGPGSTIYGDFAMTGVINIITRNSGGRIFGGGGDDHSLAAGGNHTFQSTESDLKIGLNLSAVDDGENAAVIGKNPDENRLLGVATLEYKDFTFTAESFSRKVEVDSGQAPPPPPGPLPGPPPGPPPAAENRSEQIERSWALQGRQKLTFGSADCNLTLGYLKNYSDTDEPKREFQGDRIEAGMDIELSPWSGHQLLVGLNYVDASIDHSLDQNAVQIKTADGISRNSYSLGIQDELNLGERFTLTLGLRYDYYDDVGEHLTPRIAGVYRPAEHHVVKAQYSEGFRAPTFWELYQTGSANEELDFEKIKTTELSYIYRRPHQVARLTLYHSRIPNGLFRNGALFTNDAVISSQGVEVEWEQQIATTFRWQFNLSYTDSDDNRWTQQAQDGDESLGVAKWLGNLAAFWQPLPKLTASTRLLYVGDRHATNGSVGGYETVDITLSRTDLFYKGLSLGGGVKNVFNHALVYTTQHTIGMSEDEFPGRTWWLQIAFEY